MTSLAGGCRSLSAPASFPVTLSSLRSYSLHKTALPSFSLNSNTTTFRCQFSKPEPAFTAIPSSSNCCSDYHYDRLLPCPPYIDRPPRVEHLIALEEGSVVDYISKVLHLPPLFVADLIQFGAVHYALVSPKPPSTATPEQIRLFEEFTRPLVLKKRASLKGKTIQQAQKTYRVTHADQVLEPGMYLRVYVHPRRFPRCYEIDWKSRIIAVTESYVVLDKPAGTSEKQVTKLYLALSVSTVPIGVLTHYIRPGSIAPKLVSEEFTKGWYLCQLEVLECKKVAWPDAVTKEKYRVQDCGWPLKDYAYECKINLLTGRTHQIRAQLAACGAPIVGDSMYMPAAIAEIENPGINPFGKYRKEYTSEDDESIDIAEWIEHHGKEPNVAIGLQAFQISWDDGNHIYKAGSPWWRRDV